MVEVWISSKCQKSETRLQIISPYTGMKLLGVEGERYKGGAERLIVSNNYRGTSLPC